MPPTSSTAIENNQTDTGITLRKVLVLLIPIFVLLVFIIVTTVIVKLNTKPKERRRSVNTLAVLADYARIDDVNLTVRTQGEARPQIEIDFVPQVGGKIVYVSPNFVEGGIFKKGEVLLRLEDADFQVAVTRAQANVAQAQQVLTREIAEGAIAQQDYAELGAGNASALALREPQRKQAEAALQAAQAELDGAELQLTRTIVKAPFAGRVRTKNSDLGQFVSPGFALGRIFSTDVIEVRLPLIDADLTKIDLPIAFSATSRDTAPKVTLSAIVAGQKQIWQGHIMRTSAAYDRQTRALFAVAEVVDPYGTGVSDNGVPLAPGLFVDAALAGKQFDNVIVLPRDGLRPEDLVYVVDDTGTIDVRQASVIDTDPNRAVLSSGVNVGELVVLSPLSKDRIAIPLKVLDANDPKKLLVEPPKPDWLIEQEKDAAQKDQKQAEKRKGLIGRLFTRKDKKDDQKANAPKKPLKKTDETQIDGKQTDKDGAVSRANEAGETAKP